MANFERADARTGGHEGLYANNIKDKGKETYAGIARAYWPSWPGFAIIDRVKSDFCKGIDLTNPKNWKFVNAHTKDDQVLKGLIKKFYETNFWNPLRVAAFERQEIANNIYDFGVNSGVVRAAKTAQKAFNNLKKTGAPALVEDGILGARSIAAIEDLGVRLVYDEFNRLREAFYRNAAKAPGQAQFLDTWLSRIIPFKDAA